MQIFRKKEEKYFPSNTPDLEAYNTAGEMNESILLKTIKFPKNLMNLSERLPDPNYDMSPSRPTMANAAKHAKLNQSTLNQKPVNSKLAKGIENNKLPQIGH